MVWCGRLWYCVVCGFGLSCYACDVLCCCVWDLCLIVVYGVESCSVVFYGFCGV